MSIKLNRTRCKKEKKNKKMNQQKLEAVYSLSYRNEILHLLKNLLKKITQKLIIFNIS